MKSTKINFENHHGQKLAARLELPVDGRPEAFVLFAHCFTCTKNFHAVTNISRALTQKGFGVLRFDFTGLGESEGDFAGTNFSSNVEDLITAAGYLENNYRAPAILVGHSLGGAAVIFAAARLNSVKAVASIAAPSNPVHVKQLLKDSRKEIEEKGRAKVSIGGRPFTIKKQFLDDLEQQHVKSVLGSFNAALLILHSPADKIVGIDNAAELYKMARHPKSFISLDEADHLLSDKSDSFYAGNMIAAWAGKYIDMLNEKPATEKQVLARLSGETYTTELLAGHHNLLADEPKSAGGNDLGPSPYELVASGLGACTAMTLRMYVNRKKWDLKEVRVHLEHRKEHAKDCEVCEESDTSKIDKFERIIEIEGNLDEKQKHRLLEIANKCPVHRTLTGDILVETKLR